MEAVRAIIHQSGYRSVHEFPPGEPITRSVPGFMDLCIEKILHDRVCVGHYYWQRGDRIADPEIEFKILDDAWVPVRFTQHPSVHQYEETGLASIDSFIAQWNNNLKHQGFTNEPDPDDLNAVHGTDGCNTN